MTSIDDAASAFYDEEIDSQPLVGASMGDDQDGWLERTATSILSGTLTYEMLSERARAGFTVDEITTVMTDTDLLNHLYHLWLLLGPGSSVMDAAIRDDDRGRAHRELLRRCGQLTQSRTRARHALAASTGGRTELLVDHPTDDQHTSVTRRVFHDDGMVDIAVESRIASRDRFPVLVALALGQTSEIVHRLLFLMTPDDPSGSGRSRSELTLRLDASLVSERMAFFPAPIEASRLSSSQMAAVGDSVAAAKLPWKDAWRRAAVAAPPDHPLRTAVRSGLNRRG